MTTFDPAFLEGVPAPVWLILFLKVLGFTLHLIPMGIWFIGLPIAIGCRIFPCSLSRRFSERILQQLPIFVALGINFGIVPLLFLQTMMPKPFYTATILMAWQWISVVPLLLVGYYAVYLAAFAARDGKIVVPILTGIIASICLMAIGVVMTTGMTLIVSPQWWDMLWEKTQIAAAVTGLAHEVTLRPEVWIRFAAAAALGFFTTAIWGIFDSHFLMPRSEKNTDENLAYRRWTRKLAVLLMAISLAGFGAVWFLIFKFPTMQTTFPLFGFLVALVALTWLCLLVRGTQNDLTLKQLIVPLAGYVLTISLFAIYRQTGQLAMLRNYDGFLITHESIEWSPIILFLILFVAGVLCCGWMVTQFVRSKISAANENF